MAQANLLYVDIKRIKQFIAHVTCTIVPYGSMPFHQEIQTDTFSSFLVPEFPAIKVCQEKTDRTATALEAVDHSPDCVSGKPHDLKG